MLTRVILRWQKTIANINSRYKIRDTRLADDNSIGSRQALMSPYRLRIKCGPSRRFSVRIASHFVFGFVYDSELWQRVNCMLPSYFLNIFSGRFSFGYEVKLILTILRFRFSVSFFFLILFRHGVHEYENYCSWLQNSNSGFTKIFRNALPGKSVRNAGVPLAQNRSTERWNGISITTTKKTLFWHVFKFTIRLNG